VLVVEAVSSVQKLMHKWLGAISEVTQAVNGKIAPIVEGTAV
jgi:hypothetical protein